MSYEGFEQYLCPKGHTWNMSCFDIEEAICPICKEKAIWENSVDETNGTYDENGNDITGYIELEVLSKEECQCCGKIKEATFKLPPLGKGRRLTYDAPDKPFVPDPAVLTLDWTLAARFAALSYMRWVGANFREVDRIELEIEREKK